MVCPTVQHLYRQRMHSRFSAAVKSLKVNDENDLWVRLAACNLQDSKARQVSNDGNNVHTLPRARALGVTDYGSVVTGSDAWNAAE